MSTDPLIGQVLHDTHEIVRLIGKGGMGAVYEAVHLRLRKQRFAIKVLHQRMVEDRKMFVRFQREAEIATEVGHPNIISVVDFYHTVEGLPCIVMEYLEGEDLLVRLKRQSRLAPGEVAALMEQVGSALQAVHDKGVVHRDMKPANIFLVDGLKGETLVKVLDFGISKIRDSNTLLTGDQAVLGTPHYMSPEQGEGQVRDVDHRTDIFAMGTMCYRMLSGKLPFDGATMLGVARAICDRPHEPVTIHVPGLGEQVDEVLGRALSKKKEDRYQRAEDFARDLKSALGAARASSESGEVSPKNTLQETAKQQAATSGGEAEAQARITAVPEPEPMVATHPGSAPEPNTSLPPQEPLLDPGPPAQGSTQPPAQISAPPLIQPPARVSASAAQPSTQPPAQPVAVPEGQAVEVVDEPQRTPTGAGPAAHYVPADHMVDATGVEPVPGVAVEATPAPAVAETPAVLQVSSHTTLSHAAGEQPGVGLPVQKRSSRLPALALGAAAVVVLGLGVAYLATRGPDEPDGPARRSASSAAGQVEATHGGAPESGEAPADPGARSDKRSGTIPPPPESKQGHQSTGTAVKPTPTETVAFTLHLSPPAARVLLDGRPRSENPLILERTGKRHRLEVTADGFLPDVREITASASVTIRVALTRKPVRTSRTARKHGTAKRHKDRSGKLTKDKKNKPEKQKKGKFFLDLQ